MTLGTLAILLFPFAIAAEPAVVAAPTEVAPITWNIDQAHSSVTFRIRHLVSRVAGSFNQFKGAVVTDPANLAGGSVQVEIQTASIDTNNERRDTHLRSADFLDVEKFSTMTFRSTRVETTGRNLRVHGTLTMHGVSRPVVLTGEMTGMGGAAGKRRIGFEATTTVNRKDFGVEWNRAAEGGGMMLGDDVEIHINVEAVEQAAA